MLECERDPMKYSLRKNLHYMTMAFSRPKLFLALFPEEPLYSIVPLIIFTTVYEVLYIGDYFFKGPSIHVLAAIFNIPDSQYNLYQIFFFPLIHILDFFVFSGLIYVGSRLLHLHINTKKTVLFFVFIFNTIGLVSAVTDALTFVWESEYLVYVHPITGVLFLWYLIQFIRVHAETKWLTSCILSVTSLAVTMGFRIIFLG